LMMIDKIITLGSFPCTWFFACFERVKFLEGKKIDKVFIIL
jgi:hypothetical protein